MSNNNELSATLTPYECAKLANQRFSEEGLNPIPPQMMYNYTTAKVRAGKNPVGGLVVTPEGKVTRESFTKWLESYVTKKQNA